MATKINDDYKAGLKREIVKALSPVFGPSYPNPNLANRVKVLYEFPRTQVLYPAIYITFSEGDIENVGISHYEIDSSEYERIYHWKFHGRINFNVLATTPTDRDALAAGLINIIALGRDSSLFSEFHNEMLDNDWVALHLMADRITPLGESPPTQAPWGTQDFIYHDGYSVEVFGEFWSEALTGDLIQISEIDLYPYRDGEQPAPW